MERLINGENDIINKYRIAIGLWDGIFKKAESNTVDGLAGILWSEQGKFENQCGGKSIGQEIMVASGIYQFYSTASCFGDNLERARLVANAFRISRCSMEVKHHAREIATALSIFEE